MRARVCVYVGLSPNGATARSNTIKYRQVCVCAYVCVCVAVSRGRIRPVELFIHFGIAGGRAGARTTFSTPEMHARRRGNLGYTRAGGASSFSTFLIVIYNWRSARGEGNFYFPRSIIKRARGAKYQRTSCASMCRRISAPSPLSFSSLSLFLPVCFYYSKFFYSFLLSICSRAPDSSQSVLTT